MVGINDPLWTLGAIAVVTACVKVHVFELVHTSRSIVVGVRVPRSCIRSGTIRLPPSVVVRSVASQRNTRHPQVVGVVSAAAGTCCPCSRYISSPPVRVRVLVRVLVLFTLVLARSREVAASAFFPKWGFQLQVVEGGFRMPSSCCSARCQREQEGYCHQHPRVD